MKSIAPFFFLVILSACCCNKKNKGLFYVIKPLELSKEDSSEYTVPLFYSTDNFILYNDSTIYYHGFPTHICCRCGTGLDFNKPPFLDLAPSKLLEIPIENLDSFWKNHITNSKKKIRHITISSTTDTIYNPAMLHFLKLSDFSRKILLNRRKCTEEQVFVSEAKFRNSKYDPKKLKWEIGFDDSRTPYERKTLKFIPPL